MKIVVANNFYYLRGGSERVMFDEMDALAARGHELIPFSRCHPQNRPSPYSGYFTSLLDFEKMGGLERAMNASHLVRSPVTGKAFSRLISAVSPDLIHGHNIYGGLTSVVLDVARSCRIPFFLTLHDFKLICPSYLMLNRGEICERCLGGAFWNCAVQSCHKGSRVASLIYTVESYYNHWLGKYDGVVRFLCPSRFLLDKHVQAGFPRERLCHIPNALPPSRHSRVGTDEGYVLYAGRLSREKGILTLLKAVQGLTIPLRIAGEGPLGEAAKRYVAENGLTHVRFEGYRSGEELRKLYQGAALVVIPSEWYENAPMSVLEAFQAGKAVVAANIGGIPEQVLHEDRGLLFSPGHVEELRSCLLRLWESPGLRAEFGQNALRTMENESSMERHIETLLEIYHAGVG